MQKVCEHIEKRSLEAFDHICFQVESGTPAQQAGLDHIPMNFKHVCNPQPELK